MMAYAQVQGSFTLDGSLINLAPFEQVKRKAVLGGQGGGVIGVETSSRRDSGLLRSFGWGSISSSLGDLLGTGELSSMKDMRGIASSKSVPLLSTPQSILFVDMQLAPGESKAFEYAFQLPRGLPPSHKGKAVKISYTLVIGTQRAGGTKEQQIRKVEVPFRVLGGVNSHGEILGYDLMNPYVILRDQAIITPLDKITPSNRNKAQSTRPESSLNDFITYVDDLLNRPRYGSHTGLLSPTAVPSSRRPSAYEDATTAKDAINLAILRSTHASEGGQSLNRFEIARNGQRVGVVTLTRAAYRIGEAVTMVVDFSNANVPCYALHCALESAERIADSQLALRSEASVHRVTRKVYASSSDTALYGRRLVFTPTIPINATPEFVTSGVALEWKIRVEFVVPSATTQQTKETPVAEPEESEDASTPLVGNSAASGSTNPSRNHPLLEEISRDERGGLVLVAVENLACESFEVAVPLRVYGAFATGLEKLERDEASEEGLAV
ncbi:RAB6A-GEF complex partner protein 2 like [Verticillium longisporum]|nr:RAB6A-GEF complex partner protein 2 like [Verticillium longisporum]